MRNHIVSNPNFNNEKPRQEEPLQTGGEGHVKPEVE